MLPIKAPNSKLQAPEKLQASTSKSNRALLIEAGLKPDVWNFSGAWMLVLGIFPQGRGSFELKRSRQSATVSA
jgi:hypothetical protein